jgi:hypothetical protein
MTFTLNEYKINLGVDMLTISKKSVSYSGFKLFHKIVSPKDGSPGIEKHWPSEFDMDLVPGKTYAHHFYGECKILNISIRATLDVRSFFNFWYKVSPSFETTIMFEHKLSMASWNPVSKESTPQVTFSTVKLTTFIKGLSNMVSFESALNAHIENLNK